MKIANIIYIYESTYLTIIISKHLETSRKLISNFCPDKYKIYTHEKNQIKRLHEKKIEYGEKN